MSPEHIEKQKHKTAVNSIESRNENTRIFHCFRDHLSTDEAELVLKYWTWLNALAMGRLAPCTPLQQDFIQVVKGQKKPATIYEKVWTKVVQLQNKKQKPNGMKSPTAKTDETLILPFDPLLRSQEVEGVVMQGNKRCYYRFRFAKFYGGIVTADTIGCNLLCAYCWNYDRNLTPICHQFYSPQEVAPRLLQIAEQYQCERVRISGAEPFLGENSMQHVIEVIQAVPTKKFIIETNGIILGSMPQLIERLKGFRIHVRVTVKGNDPRVTGITDCLDYQLKAIKHLLQAKIHMNVAIMPQMVDRSYLEQQLIGIGYTKAIEEEDLIIYAKTEKILKQRGL